MRFVFLDVFPDSLFCLGLACTIDIPCAVILFIWWGSPSFVNGDLVPGSRFNVKFLVRYRVDGGSGGRSEDESLDRRFVVGGFEGVCYTGDDFGNDIVGVLGEGEVRCDVSDAGAT